MATDEQESGHTTGSHWHVFNTAIPKELIRVEFLSISMTAIGLVFIGYSYNAPIKSLDLIVSALLGLLMVFIGCALPIAYMWNTTSTN